MKMYKQMLIALSNEEGFSVERHFTSLERLAAIRTFNVGAGISDKLKRLTVVLTDGQIFEATVLRDGKRTDITTLRIAESETANICQFRNFIAAINPLWAGLNGPGCETMNPLKPFCSSLAHLSTIPRFPQFSYWGRCYDVLFSEKLRELKQFEFCRVQELPNGFWVEINNCGLEDLEAKRLKLESFLTPYSLWDGRENVSCAVWMSLHDGLCLSDVIQNVENWRNTHKDVALEHIDDIFFESCRAVRERWIKRKRCDLCSIKLDNEGGISTTWIEGSFDGITKFTIRSMEASLVKWAVILGNFMVVGKSPQKISFKMVVFNSCGKKVAETFREMSM